MNRVRLFTLALVAGACALLAPAAAHAQQYLSFGSTTIFNGGTTNVAAGSAGVATTNTYNTGVIAPTRSEYVSFQIKYDFLAAPVGATPTVTFRLARSLDNSTYESTPGVVLSAQGATNTTAYVTNVLMGGIPYLRVASIENTNSTAITNISLVYGVKR